MPSPFEENRIDILCFLILKCGKHFDKVFITPKINFNYYFFFYWKKENYYDGKKIIKKNNFYELSRKQMIRKENLMKNDYFTLLTPAFSTILHLQKYTGNEIVCQLSWTGRHNHYMTFKFYFKLNQQCCLT